MCILQQESFNQCIWRSTRRFNQCVAIIILLRRGAHTQPLEQETVRKVQSIHKGQYKEFGKENRNVHKICHRNTFEEQVAKQKELTVVCSRDCTFRVKHEIEIWTRFSLMKISQPYLPSLSNGRKVRLGMKADILHFLKPNLPENRSTHAFNASSTVFQMVKRGRSKTSQEYADTTFSPCRLRLHAL